MPSVVIEGGQAVLFVDAFNNLRCVSLGDDYYEYVLEDNWIVQNIAGSSNGRYFAFTTTDMNNKLYLEILRMTRGIVIGFLNYPSQPKMVARTEIYNILMLSSLIYRVGEQKVGPNIAVDVSAIDFGDVAIGEEKEKNFQLTNNGKYYLEIYSYKISGDKQFACDGYPDTLEPGESREITVSYAPKSAGENEGTLTVYSDDPDTPELEIEITGVGTGSSEELEIVACSLDEGDNISYKTKTPVTITFNNPIARGKNFSKIRLSWKERGQTKTKKLTGSIKGNDLVVKLSGLKACYDYQIIVPEAAVVDKKTKEGFPTGYVLSFSTK